MTTRTTIAIALAMAAVALGACEASDPPEDSDPRATSLDWHECPNEVAIMMTGRHRCGTLTVPVDRARPGGQRLELSVVEAWPHRETVTDGVAASVGFNFGEPAHEAGSMASLAERLGVPVVSLAPRGVGDPGGQPLDCPEVDGLGPQLAGLPDATGRARFLDAVATCRERLGADAVELDAFGVDDLAADLEALRENLAVRQWHALVSYGELSRVSHAYATSYAGRVRAMVTDSPLPLDRDSLGVAAEGARSALAALFEECKGSPRCADRYPDLERTWHEALDRVASRDLVSNRASGRVLVDAAKLVRATRAMLGGDGPVYVADLPRVISTAAEGRVHPTLASLVHDDPGFCNGHRPLCTKPGFSMGAYLSQMCPEVAGRPSEDDEEVFDDVFAESPYVEACRIWGVAQSPIPAPATGVPVLVLTGHLDAWSRPEWFSGAVVVRGATHDVAGSSRCAIAVRNPWVADPSTPVDTTACDDAPYPSWD